jgi:hypothetical protein
MSRAPFMTYTLVQHSGWTVGLDPLFQRAVEACAVVSARDAERVRTAGGVVFASYAEACEAEERTNYPPEVKGLIPRAPGRFAERKGLGAIYVPPAEPA